MQDFENMTDHQLADAIHQMADQMRDRGNLADKLRADLAAIRGQAPAAPARTDLIQVGEVMRASHGVLGGPAADKDVIVAWVSDNGHRITTTEGESYQVPDLVRTGRWAPEAPAAWDGLRKLAGEEINRAETQAAKNPLTASYHRGGKDAWIAVLAYMGGAAPAATTEGA